MNIQGVKSKDVYMNIQGVKLKDVYEKTGC